MEKIIAKDFLKNNNIDAKNPDWVNTITAGNIFDELLS